MKRMIIACLLALTLLIPVTAYADRSPARPILYTYYCQMGWGDRVQIGYADSNGDLWALTGYDSELEWPGGREKQLQYLEEHEFEKIGTLDHDDLFDLESLVAVVKIDEAPVLPGANDAGSESTYAIQYGRDGNAVPVLLGMSGDDVYENPDPSAQGLYLAARRLFPYVTCYDGSIGPVGFIPVSLSEFCGLGDLSGASVKAYYMDCEAGPKERELSSDEQKAILDEVMNSWVTGKVSAVDTTGGYTDYYFYHRDEELGHISIYSGRLYHSDGMYSIDLPAENSANKN